MHDLATALRARDLDEAQRSLRRLRSLDSRLTALEEGLSAAQEVVRLAPLRWRERTSLAFYTEAVRHLERSLHSCRSIARRLTTALKDDEPIPEELPAAIDLLADGVQTLRCTIRTGGEPHEAREQILAAVEMVGRARGEDVPDPTRPHTHRLGYSGLIAVGEFRTAAHDLLIASGLDPGRAAALVRRAVDSDDRD